jgi:predicted methyltransferase
MSEAGRLPQSGKALRRCAAVGMIAVLALLAACTAPSPPPPDYAAIVAAPDRSDADRKTDERRDPVALMSFIGARPGMTVLDMGAGAGYSTELLARIVGPTGRVYAQDSAAMVAHGATRAGNFATRLDRPAMKTVVRLVRDYDDPLPADIHDLDLVTFLFFYHDTTYMEVDRAKMDKRLFDALKPGGYLVIADHSARPGDGVSVAHTLHRIEEKVVMQEIEAAGFTLVGEGNFLRHPEDPRDAPIFKSPVPVDEFVLKFRKPG